VGHREISAALMDEGYPITPEQVLLSEPIRQLDNVAVDLRLTEDLHSSIKVWVVRDRSEEETEDETATSEESEEARAGKEAGTDDDGTSE
jgi:hypothetical protein